MVCQATRLCELGMWSRALPCVWLVLHMEWVWQVAEIASLCLAPG
jgi:hypothetical protein